jgi:hypothetical protein
LLSHQDRSSGIQPSIPEKPGKTALKRHSFSCFDSVSLGTSGLIYTLLITSVTIAQADSGGQEKSQYIGVLGGLTTTYRA